MNRYLSINYILTLNLQIKYFGGRKRSRNRGRSRERNRGWSRNGDGKEQGGDGKDQGRDGKEQGGDRKEQGGNGKEQEHGAGAWNRSWVQVVQDR